jgi:hypothetical protein
MAQKKGEQTRVGVPEGFVHRSVKLVSLANGNRYEDDSNTPTFFLSGEALSLFIYSIALPRL